SGSRCPPPPPPAPAATAATSRSPRGTPGCRRLKPRRRSSRREPPPRAPWRARPSPGAAAARAPPPRPPAAVRGPFAGARAVGHHVCNARGPDSGAGQEEAGDRRDFVERAAHALEVAHLELRRRRRRTEHTAEQGLAAEPEHAGHFSSHALDHLIVRERKRAGIAPAAHERAQQHVALGRPERKLRRDEAKGTGSQPLARGYDEPVTVERVAHVHVLESEQHRGGRGEGNRAQGPGGVGYQGFERGRDARAGGGEGAGAAGGGAPGGPGAPTTTPPASKRSPPSSRSSKPWSRRDTSTTAARVR